MKVKVCGITALVQLQQLEQMGIPYAGIIFYEGSKRYGRKKLEKVQNSIRTTTINKVGVFVNEEEKVVKDTLLEFGLKAVQLHGNETAQFCRSLMDCTTVIKAFRLGDTQDIDAMVLPFRDAAHYFLFDTDTAGYGGSGKKFNWQMLEHAVIGKPFFLSGGIGPEDAAALSMFRHPFFYGVDVNSRFESEPGTKDMEAVKNFVTGLGVKSAQ